MIGTRMTRIAAALPLILVALGIALRVRQFLVFRSLWIDEAMLAINIVERPLAGLVAPLEYNQGAPLGFLLLQKLATLALGCQDMVLRLLPLAASAVALVLFARLTSAWLGRAGLLALALMAVATPLVDYATEIKQYSTDVLCAVALLWAARPWLEARAENSDYARLAVIGALAMWVSHPALFVLPGIGLVVAAHALRPFSLARTGAAAAVAAVWGASVLAHYRISVQALAANQVLLDYWRSYFPPEDGPQVGAWIVWALQSFFADAAGLAPPAAVSALTLVGFASLLWRRTALATVTAAPILVALAASSLGVYPFAQRLLHFAVPGIFVLATEGACCIARGAGRVHVLLGRGAGAVLALLLIAAPSRAAYERLLHPRLSEHLRPALEHLLANRRQGDGVYVYYGAKPAFRFYSKSYDVDEEGLLLGRAHRDDPSAYVAEFDTLRARARRWLVFAHNCPACSVNEQAYMLRAFDRKYRRIDSFEEPGAAVYLYSRE